MFQTNISKYLTPIFVGLTIAGGSIASATAVQPITTSSQSDRVEHLTCVRDPQGLMCNVDESSNVKSTDRVKIVAKNTATAASPTTFNSDRLAQISNSLLGIIYLGFPSLLVFAIVRHDRLAAKHTQLVAQLEKLWANSHS
jgi:hypothetical protein